MISTRSTNDNLVSKTTDVRYSLWELVPDIDIIDLEVIVSLIIMLISGDYRKRDLLMQLVKVYKTFK